MRKLGVVGTKWLKIIHITVIALWLGGIISSVASASRLSLSSYDEVRLAYQIRESIDVSIIRNGALGILLTSLIYSIWTQWGFFKHRWVTVKWVVFIAQMVAGISFLGNLLSANMALLESEKSAALTNPVFIQNHNRLQVGSMIQVILIIFLIAISVLKPWRGKNTEVGRARNH